MMMMMIYVCVCARVYIKHETQQNQTKPISTVIKDKLSGDSNLRPLFAFASFTYILRTSCMDSRIDASK